MEQPITINQIYDALDKGIEVNWHHTGYHVHMVSVKEPNRFTMFSGRGNHCLRVSYKPTYFGSYMHPNDLKHCYIN